MVVEAGGGEADDEQESGEGQSEGPVGQQRDDGLGWPDLHDDDVENGQGGVVEDGDCQELPQADGQAGLVELDSLHLGAGLELGRAGTHLVVLTGWDKEITEGQKYRVAAVPSSQVVEELGQVGEHEEHGAGLRVQLEGDGEEAESEEAGAEDVEGGGELAGPGAGLLLQGEGGEGEGEEGEEETDVLTPPPALVLHQPGPDHHQLHDGGGGAVDEGGDHQEVGDRHSLLDPGVAGEAGVEGQQEEGDQDGGEEDPAAPDLVEGEEVMTEDKVRHDVTEEQQQHCQAALAHLHFLS